MWYMYIHPLAQIAATAVGFYVLWLGLARTRSLHLGQTANFQRARHVALGKVVVYTWLFGAMAGAVLARLHWGGWLQNDAHATVALAMAPLLILSLASGLLMAAKPARRVALPALHGLCNLILLAMAVAQFFSGRALTAQLVPGL